MAAAPRRFSIATCWDPCLLEGLADLGQQYDARFEEVFGAFRQGIVGSGRQAYRLPQVSSSEVARHIRTAADLGIGYVHLLNAPEISGRLSDPVWRQDLARHLDELHALGVRTLTIAHHDLLRFVLAEFRAKFRVKLSLIAGVKSVDEAREVEDLGADVITLNPFSLNRDFEKLAAIRDSVACELELYANIPCLHECPVWSRHYRFLGRTTQIGKASEAGPDPFLQFCSKTFIENPVELIRSPFIRPEDTHRYFALGIDRIKLSDRAEGTDFLLRTASAYASGRYSGDLFELVFRGGSKFRAALGPRSALAEEPVGVTIDNDVLSSLGFLDRIRELRGPALDQFYADAAAQAVRLDPALTERWRAALSRPSALPGATSTGHEERSITP